MVQPSATQQSKLEQPEQLPVLKAELQKLQRSYQRRYQLTHIDIWALASTMDKHVPGFWHRYMENRQAAAKHRQPPNLTNELSENQG